MRITIKWKPNGCKSVDIITYDKLILKILCSKLITIQWLMANGISNERICQKCGSKMRFSKYPAHSCGYRWECRKYTKENKHYQTVSILNGSWFSTSKLNVAEILKITFWFCYDLPQKTLREMYGFSRQAITDWYNFCREVCDCFLLRKCEKIGGKDVIVEIDEAKFGKRKYNRGHGIRGQWIFGGRETENREKIFMVAVENRKAEILLPIIEKYVEKGSIIE